MFIDMQKFVESVSGGEVYIETVLWENSAPTSAFAAQDVTLSDDITNYDEIKITYYSDTVNQILRSDTMPVKEFLTAMDSYKQFALYSVYTSVSWCRMVEYVTNTSIKFYTSYRVNTSGSNTAVNVPIKIIGIKKVSWEGKEVDQLWENPSPTSDFSAQTVSLDLSKYEAVIIEGSYGTNYATPILPTERINFIYLNVGDTFANALYGWALSGGSLWNTFRSTQVTQNGVIFGSGYYNKNGTSTQSNSVAIPLRIWSLKKKLVD